MECETARSNQGEAPQQYGHQAHPPDQGDAGRHRRRRVTLWTAPRGCLAHGEYQKGDGGDAREAGSQCNSTRPVQDVQQRRIAERGATGAEQVAADDEAGQRSAAAENHAYRSTKCREGRQKAESQHQQRDSRKARHGAAGEGKQRHARRGARRRPRRGPPRRAPDVAPAQKATDTQPQRDKTDQGEHQPPRVQIRIQPNERQLQPDGRGPQKGGRQEA